MNRRNLSGKTGTKQVKMLGSERKFGKVILLVPKSQS